MIVTLELPRLTSSLNKMLREHWRKYKWKKDAFIWELIIADKDLFRLNHPCVKGEKRNLEFISYRTKILDRDNFIGGLKPLIDALKDLKFIYEDDLQHLYFKAKQKKIKARSNQRTEIKIITKGG